MIAGLLSGLIGIGGGIIMVPAMVYFLNMSQHESQGTSLFAIIPTAIAGASLYTFQGHMDFNIVIWISIGGFAGAYMGSLLAGRLSEKTLKILYAFFLVIVGVKMFL